MNRSAGAVDQLPFEGRRHLPRQQRSQREAEHKARDYRLRFLNSLKPGIRSIIPPRPAPRAANQWTDLPSAIRPLLPAICPGLRSCVQGSARRGSATTIMPAMSSIASDPAPDAQGHFGPYGGRYVPETLMHPLQELETEYFRAQQDPEFQREFEYYLREFCGRPTPLYFAERLTRELGGAKIYLKREDLLHTGAHKINNCIGQILLARRMGKTRIIAETGAGQHGVATATVAAMFGLKCVVYMGAVDCERQSLNVLRMKMLGAEVVPVKAGQQTLKEAINEAMRDWVTNVRTTHYILGTVYGAHPYPLMVRNFQRVIGDEARRQILEKEGRLPDLLVACVGGGSNAMGLFYPFLQDESVGMVGVEAGGEGIAAGKHAARFQGGSLACCKAPGRISCRTSLARSSSRTAYRRAWTTRRLGPSMPGCET